MDDCDRYFDREFYTRLFGKSPYLLEYILYVKDVLSREGVPVISVTPNTFSKYEFAVEVRCSAPWGQYDRRVSPGRWAQTIRQGETVHDIVFAYRRDYPPEAVAKLAERKEPSAFQKRLRLERRRGH